MKQLLKEKAIIVRAYTHQGLHESGGADVSTPKDGDKAVEDAYAGILMAKASEMAKADFLEKVYPILEVYNKQSLSEQAETILREVEEAKGEELSRWEEIKSECLSLLEEYRKILNDFEKIGAYYTAKWIAVTQGILSQGLSLPL